MELVNYFSYEEGNFLIRLLIAHIVADFIFQTKKMVEEKSFFSLPMLWHIIIVFICTLIFSGFDWILALIISIAHWVIDGLKCIISNQQLSKEKSKRINSTAIYISDQLLHILIILGLWAACNNLLDSLYKALIMIVFDYKLSLIILGYGLIIFPVRYAIEKITENLINKNKSDKSEEEELEHGGKLIGIFERIIILTFVLYGEYEAIGFLITGKSILRLNTKKQTEYVLVGTMTSYALAIITGVLINWLLTIK